MKRAFIILFTILIALYARQGYKLLTTDGTNACLISGLLSDIAEEVVAIPLKESKEYNIRYAKQVRKEGDNLFLICNETIYRFNGEGKLIKAITDPETIRAGGYIIDKHARQLIVFGNEDNVHYYTFDGELIETKKLQNNIAGERICSIAMHNNSIWTTEECTTYNPDTNQVHLEMLAVRYDSSFTQLESRRIAQCDLGREQELTPCHNNEFCVNTDTGMMYLYAPPLSSEYLMRDTLYLRHYSKRPGIEDMPVFPVRMGGRFWLAACDRNQAPLQNYLFCYDTYTSKTWQLADGFEDNYYGTGSVNNLHPIDIYNRNYYFCRSGEELSHSSFQEIQDVDLVVFIVKLKA